MSLDQLVQDFNDAVIDALTASFGIVVGEQTLEPGEAIRFEVTPSLADLTVPHLQGLPIDLEWLGKLLSFDTSALSNVAESGVRLPSVTDAIAAAAHTIAGALPSFGDDDAPSQSNDVAGTAGLLHAAMPMQFPLVPVRVVAVDWEVEDVASGQTLVENSDYVVDVGHGVQAGIRYIRFMPVILELKEGQRPAAIQLRRLRAKITLAVLGTTLPRFTTPEVEVPVPVLRVPTILALYVQPQFDARRGLQDGPVAVVVPARSPLRHMRIQEMRNELLTLQAGMGQLRMLEQFASFVDGLDDLVRALNPERRVALVGADEIRDLSLAFFEGGSERLEQLTGTVERLTQLATEALQPVMTLAALAGLQAPRPTGPPGFLRLAAGDSINSLILFGPPNRRVELFNRRDFDATNGQLNVAVPKSPVAVLVHDLDVPEPESDPGGAAAVVVPPQGRRCLIYRIRTFGDQISSLRFA